MKKAFKAAFPVTIPVIPGYLFVGIAFGLLFEKAGYNFLWALLMSGAVYAGSMQFVAIHFFSGGFGLIEIALMTLVVNIRHIFYGLSFIEKFREMGNKKPYMIFSLTDETYSLLLTAKTPEGIDSKSFFLIIALLNQIYWITGSVIGSVAGSIITFNTAGIDFAMTALFIVIFIEQWLSNTTHIPAMTGIICTILSFLIFGKNNLVLPSLIFSVMLLISLRRFVDVKKMKPVQGDPDL